jgi:hypothetical protein
MNFYAAILHHIAASRPTKIGIFATKNWTFTFQFFTVFRSSCCDKVKNLLFRLSKKKNQFNTSSSGRGESTLTYFSVLHTSEGGVILDMRPAVVSQ